MPLARPRRGGAKTSVTTSAITNANQAVEAYLHGLFVGLEQATKADCLMYVGPLALGADDDIRDAVEEISNRRNKLVFVVETLGGYAETVNRIVDAVRQHYAVVDYIVPNYAMSAGTILVMSGDAIYMDYHSILGPIDPQVEGPKGGLVSALGYLKRYEELLARANQGKVSTAEMDILLSFDQAELYAHEQARDLSVKLLEEWLVKYKFKDWKQTQTKKKKVTEKMKIARANEVAKKLNDVAHWHSHGMGINMKRVREELNLKIDDFAQDKALNKVIRPYRNLFVDYMSRLRLESALQTRMGFKHLVSR